jgi:HAD superfamily phosphoserine phosphatase-like hydrolase
MDGTLTDGDSWAYTNAHFGTKNTYIYDYLRGRISYERYLELVCSQWISSNGGVVYYEDLEEAVKGIEARPGLAELLAFARKNEWKTGIISAGIDTLSGRLSRVHHFDFALANGFEFFERGEKRELTGRGVSRVPLLEKGRILEGIAGKEPVISVGDTRYDVPMFRRSLASVAMNPKDSACASNATMVIRDGTFYPLIERLEKFLEEQMTRPEHK